MPLIAVTGGIASGKSTISQRLAERGAVVIDADQVVRDLQQPGQPVLSGIVAAFGDGVLRPDGTLDRAALGAIAFGDADSLRRLNDIVHPAVNAETRRRFDVAFAADPGAVVVYDVPLLAEARGTEEWDLVVVAHAPANARIRRMVEDRGMAREDAEARIANQASDEDRLGIADIVIDTDGTMADTIRAADDLWESLRVK